MAGAVVYPSGNIGLTLSTDEAAALAAVFARVGGSPGDSPRGHIDSMARALLHVGFHFADRVAAECYELITGMVEFEDYPPVAAFVPGYYRDSGDGEVRLFETDPVYSGYFAEGIWQRVNVTPADD